ncbi:MAG TPA: LON peptidase substrate-binding domain-containing protein [Burkholderiales bacterium]|nr:LON peptidase substrate-binding domain-containing protein [Burkholderiales bacterium]
MLFPGGRLPLRIFETRYMDMAKACLRDATPFGVCLIVEGREVGAPAIPAPVGTLARIAQWDMPQLGLLNVLAEGAQRFRILERRVQPDGLALASVALLEDERDAPIPKGAEVCARLLERMIAEQPALFAEPRRLDSSAWVAARLAELLPLPLELKQELLELGAGDARLERISRLLRADARSAS